MSKHSNKHWIREKEFISLKMEEELLWDTLPRSRWRILPDSRFKEVNRKLLYKFYNEMYGKFHTAPKWYRKMKNKIQRAKSKQTLYRLLNDRDVSFEDNYRDAPWYW